MMNGNQSEQNNSRTNVLSSFADSSINVRNPPLDNLNPSAYSTNASFFQDAAENGLMQSYSSQTSSLVYQMVQQLHNYVKDNEDLKKTVRSNNEELERRFRELEEWKRNQKTEKLKLKENFEKAHKFTTQLKNENALLKSKNIKLELRIQQLSSIVSENTKTNVTLDQHSEGDNKNLHKKYLSTVAHLEHQLKEAISSRDEALSSKKKVESLKDELAKSNQLLQQKVAEFQYRFKEMETIKQSKRSLETTCRDLTKQLNVANEKTKVAEKTNMEVKAQLLQAWEEVKAYENEKKSLQSEKQHCVSELNDARAHIAQVQAERNQEKSNLEQLISEKTRALDDLFNDYNHKRIECDRLSADRDSLIARIFSAEESMQRNEREAREFVNRHKEEIQKLQDDVNFFKAQAEVYKLDFLQEREDRTQTHQENERLRNQLEQLQMGNRYDPTRR